MWTMYKELLVRAGTSRRDPILAQGAFCRHGRTIRVLQGRAAAEAATRALVAALRAAAGAPRRRLTPAASRRKLRAAAAAPLVAL
jgi:hypothetical protein